jgi:hypothetical protein
MTDADDQPSALRLSEWLEGTPQSWIGAGLCFAIAAALAFGRPPGLGDVLSAGIFAVLALACFVRAFMDESRFRGRSRTCRGLWSGW